jgi:predicted dehydrogenase
MTTRGQSPPDSAVQNPLRVGVVGLEFGVRVHAPAFASLNAARVVAVAGRDLQRTRTAADSLERLTDCPVAAYDSWSRMLDEAAIDVLTVAVPPASQPKIAVAAAQRGVAVFCEKPIASMLGEAERLFAAVTASGVGHAVNFGFPEHPAWMKTRDWLFNMQPKLQVRLAMLAWHVESRSYRQSSILSWKTALQDGGGALNNFGAHSIYYLEWLFGPLDRVLARILPSRLVQSEGPRLEAWLDFQSGSSVTVSIAVNCPARSQHRLEIYADEGMVELTDATSTGVFNAIKRGRDGTELRALDALPANADVARIWSTAQIAGRLVQQVRLGGRVRPDLEDGLRVSQVLDCMRRSDECGHWIEVPNERNRT